MSWFNKLFMSYLIWLLHQNKRIFCGVYVINFIPCYVENKALFYNKITTCGLKYKVGVSDKDCHSMKGYPYGISSASKVTSISNPRNMGISYSFTSFHCWISTIPFFWDVDQLLVHCSKWTRSWLTSLKKGNGIACYVILVKISGFESCVVWHQWKLSVNLQEFYLIWLCTIILHPVLT